MFLLHNVWQILLDRDLQAVKSLGQVCKDRVTLASTLLKIFRHEREEIFLLKTMNSLEIENQGKVKVVIYLLRFLSHVKRPKQCPHYKGGIWKRGFESAAQENVELSENALQPGGLEYAGFASYCGRF